MCQAHAVFSILHWPAGAPAFCRLVMTDTRWGCTHDHWTPLKKCLPAATMGIKNKQTKKKHDKECTAVNPTHQIVVWFGLRSRRRRTCDAHSFVPEDAKQSRVVRLEVLPLFYNAKEKKPKRNSLNIFIFTRQNKWISMDLKEWRKYSLQALSDYPQNIGGSLCLRCDK